MNRQSSNRARERKLRAKYRRNLRIAIVLSLIIGAAGGFVTGQYVAKTHSTPSRVNPYVSAAPTDELNLNLNVTPTPAVTEAPTQAPTPTPTPAVTEAPTDTPTLEPTATPTPAPTATPAPQVVVVPFGETASFSAQIHNDGSVRRTADSETYETLNFTLEVKRYLTPEYYAENYSTKYQMQGDEAGVEFELTLNDYTGSQTITPQDLLTIGLETLGGSTEQGFQLTDAEIHGDNQVTIETNIPKMFYKRFKFSPSVGDMDYLSVSAVVDGVSTQYLFELGAPVRPTATPVPEVVYTSLSTGSSGDEVKTLQEALVAQGYLTGSADGKFGSMTEQAVRAAQAALGLTETGIADNEFQQKLYAAQNN